MKEDHKGKTQCYILKVPIDKTIGRSLGNESLEENFCILGVPYIRAGAEPEGYNLSYSILFKNYFCFQLT